MITVRHFEAGDLAKMNIQAAQTWGSDNITLMDQEEIARQPYSYTALDGNEVIACFGIAQYWRNRGLGWTYLSKDIGRRMLPLTRICKQVMEDANVRRIEAAVDCDFPQGHRWMRLLGMEKEAECMKAFAPNGKDCSLYAMVK